MLTVRIPQLLVLSAAARACFIDDRVVALREQFPERVAALGDPELRGHVDGCIARAQGYGIESRLDLSRYLNVAAAHGWELEDMPQHAWMKRYLCDPGVTSPSQRIDRLLVEILSRAEADIQARALRREFA
jgi:hypothetical protein